LTCCWYADRCWSHAVSTSKTGRRCTGRHTGTTSMAWRLWRLYTCCTHKTRCPWSLRRGCSRRCSLEACLGIWSSDRGSGDCASLRFRSCGSCCGILHRLCPCVCPCRRGSRKLAHRRHPRREAPRKFRHRRWRHRHSVGLTRIVRGCVVCPIILRYVRVSILPFYKIGLLLVFCRASPGELRQQAHTFRPLRFGFGRCGKARESRLSNVQREDS
jgi:hypothetical protein